MRRIYTLITVLLSYTSIAQSDWKKEAITYFDLIQDQWMIIEAREQLQLVIDAMEEETTKASPEFLHLLAVFNGHQNKYIPLAMKASSIEGKIILLLELGFQNGFGGDIINPYFEEAYNLVRSNPDINPKWKVEVFLSKARDSNGTQSLKYLDTALSVCKAEIGHSGVTYVKCLREMADHYNYIGDLEKANEWNLKAIAEEKFISGASVPVRQLFEFRNPAPALTGPAETEVLLAGLFQNELLQYGSELTKTLFSRGLEKLSPDDEEQIAALSYLTGLAYLDNAQADSSIAYFIEAKKKYNSIKDSVKFGGAYAFNAHMLIGVANYEAQNWNEADAIFSGLDDLLIQSGMEQSKERYSTLHNLLLTSEKLQDLDKFRRHISEFLKLEGYGVDEGNPERLRKYGQLAASFNDSKLAYSLYQKAYDLYWLIVEYRTQDEQWQNENDPDYPAEWMENIVDGADVLLEIGLECVAYRVGERPVVEEYRSFLKDLAMSAFDVEDYGKCQEYILEFVNEYYNEIESSQELYGFGNDLGEIYRLRAELFPLYDKYQLSLILHEQEAKSVLIQERIRAFNHILDAKSNVQFEYRHMRETIAKSTDESLKLLYAEYLKKRNEFSDAMNSQSDSELIKQELNLIQLELSEKSAAFKSTQRKRVFWNEIKESLGKGEAVVEIRKIDISGDSAQTDKVYYVAFILSSKSKYPEMIVLSNGIELERELFKSYRNKIQYKLEDTQSYAQFWGPISDYLKGIKRVYLSPDGIYNQISINSLRNSKTGKYVLEEIELINIISSKQLATSKPDEKEIENAILMGRPMYYIEGWSPEEEFFDDGDIERALTRNQIASGKISDLPGTEEEIKTIENVLKKSGIESSLYLGTFSTEANFKGINADILHVATHGFWFEEKGDANIDPMFNSGLLFAGVKNNALAKSPTFNDGILTAYEIQGLSLEGTQLAVLSACETGLGQVQVGEGVFGLQRALTIAGVDKLIMSMWKVDDNATRDLFSAFYAHWIGKKKDIVEAFRIAQREMRIKYVDPYYWGGFVLID